MKHKQQGRKFGRVRRQRKALLSSLCGNLILKEKMTTTEAKAKETKRVIDKIINKAKLVRSNSDRKVAILRDLRANLSAEAVKKLSGDFVKKFEGRNCGYTRVIKLEPRKDDAAKMAVIEFILTG